MWKNVCKLTNWVYNFFSFDKEFACQTETLKKQEMAIIVTTVTTEPNSS